MLMSVCSGSEIKSKSDLGVKSGISVRNHKNHVFVSVRSNIVLGVRLDINVKNHVVTV